MIKMMQIKPPRNTKLQTPAGEPPFTALPLRSHFSFVIGSRRAILGVVPVVLLANLGSVQIICSILKTLNS